MTSVDLLAQPSVAFAPQSAGETETAIIAAYEAIAQTTLQPGDPVRLFLESLAYILSVQNGLIDLAGKQNLLAYARGGHLDHLGAPMGVIRIKPQPARTTVRFGLDEALSFDVPIPAGTRVTTQSGGVMFATLSDAVLPAGELFVETPAKATEAGASATQRAGPDMPPRRSAAVHHAGEQRGHRFPAATRRGTSGSANVSAWLRRAFPLPGRTARMKRGSRR